MPYGNILEVIRYSNINAFPIFLMVTRKKVYFIFSIYSFFYIFLYFPRKSSEMPVHTGVSRDFQECQKWHT